MSPEGKLAGQTVVIIGGTSGVGLKVARRARAAGAELIITGRDPDALHEVGLELGASIASIDVTDSGRLGGFFDELTTVDHILVTGPGPLSAAPAELDIARVARRAAGKVRAGGAVLFVGGSGDRSLRDLALELAPVRVNLIAAGVDNPAELAIHLMTNTVVTGVTVDIDAG